MFVFKHCSTKTLKGYANTNEHKMQVQCFINTNISNVLTTVLILLYMHVCKHRNQFVAFM